MKLTSPNDVKRPDKPNVDHIIEEIEKKFENEDFIEFADGHVSLLIKEHKFDELNLIIQIYTASGWGKVIYTDYLVTSPSKGHIVSFYF